MHQTTYTYCGGATNRGFSIPSMSFSNKRLITMERSARRIIKLAFKIVNLILCIFGIVILLYSLWMIMVVLKKYRKYFFASWFLWASIATGIIFCFTACIGYAAAITRSKIFLSCYIVSISLLLLMEILVTGDVFMNDKWYKDFPKDPARRFEDFVDFVEDHRSTFKSLFFFLLLLQVIAFGLAMSLRLIRTSAPSYFDNDANQISAGHGLPFLAHQVGPAGTYVVGHPYPAAHGNLEEGKREMKGSISSGERDAWFMATHGCPPPPSYT